MPTLVSLLRTLQYFPRGWGLRRAVRLTAIGLWKMGPLMIAQAVDIAVVDGLTSFPAEIVLGGGIELGDHPCRLEFSCALHFSKAVGHEFLGNV